MAQQTPFYPLHVQANAKIIDFGGFDMPVQYKGIKIEHMAVRQAVGLFDVSHMGEFVIEGPQALDLIQKVTINDASKIQIGQAQYSAMCYEDGGIVDDLLIYRLAEQRYMLVVNASNIDKDFHWIETQRPKYECNLVNESPEWCLLALQGPKAPDLLNELTPDEFDASALKYYTFSHSTVAGMPDIIVAATGYTGEKGFELYFKNKANVAECIWNALIEKGKSYNIEACGLGARDTLRLEKGYALYGNDIDQTTNPIEAKMGWLTKIDKGDFIGKEAILKAKESVERKLIGFEILDKSIARHGYEVVDPENTESVIGVVTSGTRSISLDKSIGMAYVPLRFAKLETEIVIKVRKKEVKAVVTKVPFL